MELEHIRLTFNKRSPNEKTVFDDFSLKINAQDFVLVTGGNGSGKSTLLNLIAGNVRQDSGRILFDGTDISGLTDYERSRWISRIFQNPLAGTVSELSILENFRLASRRTKRKGLSIGLNEKFRREVRDRIAQLGLGLEDRLDLEMGHLSGGQRQALSLIMAIMDETKLLLLDEPAAALDPKTSVLIMKLADEVIMKYKLTAILVTHRLSDVPKYGNRIIQLQDGKIIRDLQKEEKDRLQPDEISGWFTQ